MYMSPVAEILEIKAQSLLAGSLVDKGDKGVDVIIPDDPEPGDAEEAAAPAYEPYKVLWTLLLLMLMTLTVRAQNYTTVEPAGPAPDGKTHAMKIYLRNGLQMEYTIDQLSHVTYLPGIGMKVYLKSETVSVDFLFSQMVKVEYEEDNNANANWKVVDNLWSDYPEAWRLEYPQVSYNNLSSTIEGAETKSQIVVKRTDDYGITYSLE